MKKWIAGFFLLYIPALFILASNSNSQVADRVIIYNSQGPCTPGINCRATVTPVVISGSVSMSNAAAVSLVVFQSAATLTTKDGGTYINSQGFLDTTPVTVASMSSTQKAFFNLYVINQDPSNTNPLSIYVNGSLYGQFTLVPGAFVDVFKDKLLAPSSNVYCTGTTLVSFQSDLREYAQ